MSDDGIMTRQERRARIKALHKELLGENKGCLEWCSHCAHNNWRVYIKELKHHDSLEGKCVNCGAIRGFKILAKGGISIV